MILIFITTTTDFLLPWRQKPADNWDTNGRLSSFFIHTSCNPSPLLYCCNQFLVLPDCFVMGSCKGKNDMSYLFIKHKMPFEHFFSETLWIVASYLTAANYLLAGRSYVFRYLKLSLYKFSSLNLPFHQWRYLILVNLILVCVCVCYEYAKVELKVKCLLWKYCQKNKRKKKHIYLQCKSKILN